MGTDIHLFIEGKINDEWVLLLQPDEGRDYNFFSALSGVRGAGEEVFPELSGRSLPNDLSEDVKRYMLDEHGNVQEGLHDAGWLSYEQTEVFFQKYAHIDTGTIQAIVKERERSWLFWKQRTLEIMRVFKESGAVEDVRMIFCYDS